MNDTLIMRTVRFVDLETAPDTFTYGGGPRVSDIDDDVLRAAIEAIEPDGSRCRECEGGVGVVLVGDEDRPTWQWVTVVASGDQSWLLCEDCSGALAAPYVAVQS